MNKHILDYLNNIDSTQTVNKLIVSAFLNHKKISSVKNTQVCALSYKKTDSDYNVFEAFESLLQKEQQSFCFEELLELFEFVISPSDKLINGAIYTPKNIRQYIIKQSFNELPQNNLNNIKVADIACGCGGFLIDAARELKEKTNKTYKSIFKENLFGIDVQKYSIERTKILLSLLAISKGEDEKIFEFNLYIADSLLFNWKEHNAQIEQNCGFDLILGNPPYVCSRNMDAKTKELMEDWAVSKTGHPDLYIPFFQIGHSLLAPSGVLGFITVNTFINSVNGRAIREYFTRAKVLLKIIDFQDEQVFKGRMTYTCLCFIKKVLSDQVHYVIKRQKDLTNLKTIKFISNNYETLDAHKGWSLKNNTLTKHIESIGIPFGKIYETKSGIATLKNNVYFFKPIKEDDKYYYLNKSTPIEKEICKDLINSNKLNKSKSINDLKEKLIFPYEYDDNGQVVLLKESVFIKKFPCAYRYLMEQKELLSTRDKGKGNYPAWYAFGRTQSLEKKQSKLFFPHLVKKGFNAVLNSDEDLYFYNGMAAYADEESLLMLKQILQSDVFWSYIENSAKPYASGYYGLGKNTLKDFGVYAFSDKEKKKLLAATKKDANKFLTKKYSNIPLQ